MSTYRICALIPVYNHAATVAAVQARLAELGLPCVLVDDGSSAECAALLDRLAQQADTHLLRRIQNGGKGAAVQDGLRHAARLGYSHALQVDADGQHDLSVLPQVLAAARAEPAAFIGGVPVYDAQAPRARRIGRWATHVWVWINTLSTAIPDSMCGLRLYPLAASLAVLDAHRLGQRMEFDIEILVHLAWRAVPMRWLPVAVHYPENGVSHFRLWRDNLLIARMHTRLFFGMLRRAPRLLARLARGHLKPVS